jgi:hypothetical protein
MRTIPPLEMHRFGAGLNTAPGEYQDEHCQPTYFVPYSEQKSALVSSTDADAIKWLRLMTLADVRGRLSRRGTTNGGAIARPR